MKQNVSYVEVSNTHIDPIMSIDRSEYSMMHNDSESPWGHRDNILDRYHTHVSVIIQHGSESRKNIQISGSIATVILLRVFTFSTMKCLGTLYEKHKNDCFYEFGKLIAEIPKPLPSNYYYLEPST